MNIFTPEVIGVPISDLTTREYNTIIAGIAYGFIDQLHCTEIETCIGDGKDEAELAYDAFTLMISSDKADNIAGLVELTQVIQALPGMMTDCRNTQDDIATIEAWGLNLAA